MAETSIVRAIKGMNDVRPGAEERFLDSDVWQRMFEVASRVLGGYGYDQVYLPVVEATPLFARGIGEATDIVSKEMYTFSDRGERSLTLRPEGTAGAVRAYVEHNLGRTDPMQRWWYAGPMFRAERPQKGRYRQFFQIGAELFGAADPSADAEMLQLVWRLCDELGLRDVTMRINTLGDDESRRAYRERLRGYFHAHAEALCESCRERIETNPLRILDCKRPSCREVTAGAPDIFEVLSPASRGHFDEVCKLLGELGVPYGRDRQLVRGLDYYTGTTFELTTTQLGAQDALLGGGRYDNLVQELGGPPTPAIGFAAGVERIALLLAEKIARVTPDLYLIPMTGLAGPALRLADALRREGGWRVEVDVSGQRLKQQMRRADRLGAKCALVLGEQEVASGHGKLKHLSVSSDLDVGLTPPALHLALGHVLGSKESS